MPRLRYSMRERLPSLVPGLVLGVAAGLVGGVLAAGALDTTDYGRADLNTVARKAHQQGSAQGWQRAEQLAAQNAADMRAANDEQVGRLTDELATSNRVVKTLRARVADQRGKLTELRGSLDETTAALESATTVADTAGRKTVAGTLRATWELGIGAKPWPSSCAPVLDSYGIRVVAGQDATVATGRLVSVELTKRAEQKNRLRLSCSMAYTATLPTPLGSAYEFVVTDADGTALQAEQASGLGDGTAPTLATIR